MNKNAITVVTNARTALMRKAVLTPEVKDESARTIAVLKPRPSEPPAI